MSHVEWGDHRECRLELTHLPSCGGRPHMDGGTDQRAFCADGCVNLSITGQDFDLPVGKLAEFVTTLYGTAGKPAPIILERPAPREVLVPDAHRAEAVRVAPSPAGHPANLPGVELTVPVPLRLIGDEPLRVAVALIDAMREAGSEPDPVEIEELAAIMRQNPGVSAEYIARDILRAGWKREAAS